MKKIVGFLIALTLSHRASAGVRADYQFSSNTSNGRSGGGQVALEIDGSRFRIVRAHGQIETSLDDGATTFFGRDRTVIQTPLATETDAISLPMKARLEDEKITISEPQIGPVLFGATTRVYTIDHEYTVVGRIALVFTRRWRGAAHYVLTVADLDVSPAAMRVVLSRGYGGDLAPHADAFRGLPLRLEGRLETNDGGAFHQVTTVHFEAVSVWPWSWLDSGDQ